MMMLLPLPLLLSCSPSDPAGTTGGSVGIDCPTPSAWYVDGDGDGFGAGPVAGQGCVRPDGQVANDQDCDDTDPAVNPFSDEVCNGVDDDCDGLVDPTAALDVVTCYTDADGDGYGDADAPILACTCTDGLVQDDQDCDDTDPDAWPGAPETLYDGIDEDCAGLTGEYDRDGDGYDWVGGKGVIGTDCDDDDPTINPGVLDLCDDDIDQDCDGVLTECGFDDVNDPDDAWWQVYRDPSTSAEGVFGFDLVPAGDSDGDGRPELLGAVVDERCGRGGDKDLCANDYHYVLLEAPSGTSGGRFEIHDATIATWDLLDDDDQYWTGTGYSRADEGPVADIDLDGDGIGDYLMVGTGDWLDGDHLGEPWPSRVDLWYGPPTYGGPDGDVVMDLNNAQTIRLEGNVQPSITLSTLVMPGGDLPWTVAVGVWPRDDTLEGTEIPNIMLFTQDHFSGASDPADAVRILGGDRQAGGALYLETADVDGDGFSDLVTASVDYDTNLPLPQVWAFAGPITADTTLADADLIITGKQSDDGLPDTLSITDDNDGDGRLELVISHTEGELFGPDAAVYLVAPGPLDTPTAIGFDDASYARVVADGDIEPARAYAHRMVGDIDGDGVPELALPVDDHDMNRVFLMDAPATGTYLVTEADIQIHTDESIDPYANFGILVRGGTDYDGDGWPDLVIGEDYWDANPDTFYDPFGRFMVWRGAVGL